MSKWREEKREEIINGILGYFQHRQDSDPAATLQEVEQELDSQFFRLGNDWTGRGVVMDTVITATIEALEIVRSNLLVEMEQNNSKTNNHNKGNIA